MQLGTRAGDHDATAWHAGQLVTIRWYQGRLVELLPMLTELASSSTLSDIDHASHAALAVAAAQAGDRLRAAGALATLRGRDLGDLPRSSSWLVTMNGIVEAAHLLDDAQTSARAYELLLPFAGLPMIVSLGTASLGSVEHALGVASLTAGEADRAVEHLRAAIQANLALGHWPAVQASRRRYDQALALAAGDPAGPATCTPQGHGWTVNRGRRSAFVRHAVGMLHLAVLLANPGTEIAAAELAAGADALAGRADVSTQPVLDRTTVQQYRARLASLRETIEAKPGAAPPPPAASTTGWSRTWRPPPASAAGSGPSPTTASGPGWRSGRRSAERSTGSRPWTRRSAGTCATPCAPAGPAATARPPHREPLTAAPCGQPPSVKCTLVEARRRSSCRWSGQQRRAGGGASRHLAGHYVSVKVCHPEATPG